MKEHPVSLEVICGQLVESLAVVGFLDENYHYQSVATQIPHDARLAPVRPGIEPGTAACEAVILSLRYGSGLTNKRLS